MRTAEPPNAERVRSRVLEAVRREPVVSSPVFGRRRAKAIAVGFALSAAVAALNYTASNGGTADSDRVWRVVADGAAPRQPPTVGYGVTIELAWLVIAGLSTWGGVMRGRSLAGRSGRVKAAVAVLTPLGLLLAWFAIGWVGLESMDEAPPFSVHARCATMEVVYAAGPLTAFVAFRRSKDPWTPSLSGAAMAAVAGAWGALVQFPFCDCTSPLHIALGHALPVFGLAGLGLLVGSRFLAVHAVRPAAAHR